MRGKWLLAVVAIAVVAMVAFLLARASAVTVLSGEAHSADNAISIFTDDWTYSVPLEGVTWVDTNNTWHEQGRPECLPPSTETIPVTFATVQVTIEGATWRPVVWVSCR